MIDDKKIEEATRNYINKNEWLYIDDLISKI